MTKKTFGVRLEEDLVEQINEEAKRRSDAVGVRIRLTSMVAALVKERLAEIQEAGR